LKLKYKILILFVIIILTFLSVSIYWVNDYYKADNISEFIESSEKITVNTSSNLLSFEPKENSTIGIIFYPGGKVAFKSYSPITYKLSNLGFTVIIPKMPLNLAIFGINKADNIIEDFSNIETWYICGHSLGGAMASRYINNNPDKLEGIIFLGSYSDIDLSNLDIKCMSIYGSLDGLGVVKKNETYKNNLPSNSKFVIIEGGNHCNFGNYGFQIGDNTSTISSEKQQNITVEEINKFIQNE
jgi:hypothetical protein